MTYAAHVAASTVVTSILTGSGVLAAAVVTQLVAARMETKRAVREEGRRVQDREEREAIEARGRRERLEAERRTARLELYRRFAAELTHLSAAAIELNFQMSGNTDRNDAIGRAKAIKEQAEELMHTAALEASEELCRAFTALYVASVALHNCVPPSFREDQQSPVRVEFLDYRADGSYAMVMRDVLAMQIVVVAIWPGAGNISRLATWSISRLRYEAGYEDNPPTELKFVDEIRTPGSPDLWQWQ